MGRKIITQSPSETYKTKHRPGHIRTFIFGIHSNINSMLYILQERTRITEYNYMDKAEQAYNLHIGTQICQILLGQDFAKSCPSKFEPKSVRFCLDQILQKHVQANWSPHLSVFCLDKIWQNHVQANSNPNL